MAEPTKIKQTIPIEMRIIYDAGRYRCEFRQSDIFFKTVNGDFLPSDNGLTGRINKLAGVMTGG